MWDIVTVEDLFTAGIGCDMAGAYLLAKGLLMEPADIRSMCSTRNDYNAPQMGFRVADRVAGWHGVVALLAGFGMQAVGYLLVIGLDVDSERSWPRAGVALGLGVVAATLVLVAHRLLRDQSYRREIAKVAWFNGYGQPQQTADHVLLRNVATQYWQPQFDESTDAYVHRVFGDLVAAVKPPPRPVTAKPATITEYPPRDSVRGPSDAVIPR